MTVPARPFDKGKLQTRYRVLGIEGSKVVGSEMLEYEVEE